MSEAVVLAVVVLLTLILVIVVPRSRYERLLELSKLWCGALRWSP